MEGLVPNSGRGYDLQLSATQWLSERWPAPERAGGRLGGRRGEGREEGIKIDTVRVYAIYLECNDHARQEEVRIGHYVFRHGGSGVADRIRRPSGVNRGCGNGVVVCNKVCDGQLSLCSRSDSFAEGNTLRYVWKLYSRHIVDLNGRS